MFAAGKPQLKLANTSTIASRNRHSLPCEIAKLCNNFHMGKYVYFWVCPHDFMQFCYVKMVSVLMCDDDANHVLRYVKVVRPTTRVDDKRLIVFGKHETCVLVFSNFHTS